MQPAATENAPPAPPAPVASWLAGLAGVAAVIIGTFLPWVVSGTVDRNVYAIAGVANRMGLLGSGSWIARWLPLLGPMCVLPALLTVLGLRRTAAVWALVLALACGGSAGAALTLAAGRSVAGVALATSGPVTVVIGSLLLALGAIGQLAAPAVHRRRDPAPAAGMRRTPTGDVPDSSH